MSITHLRYAQAVAREGTFSGAARVCSVTQPALSNGIAVLERQLGGRLFDRTTRGVTPTPLGERVLPLIEKTLQGLDSVLLEARFARTQTPRPLHIGISSLIDHKLIANILEAANAIRPDHGVLVRAADLTELYHSLTEATLDLLLIPEIDPAPGLERTPIAQEPMLFIGAHSGIAPQDAMPTPIELSATATMPFILPSNACGLTPFIHKLYAEHGLPLRTYAGQPQDCTTLQDWATLGLGSALLPASKVNDGTPARPLHHNGTPVTMTHQACWLPASPLRAEITEIVTEFTTRRSTAARL